ncbi:hypothetical protein [Myceligenerans crystallogenes]|uniref:Mce-associated membrane protein n=1 Tax=Myceligenerans crystallogenes TaxID=316335 RepID=A0ABN2NDM5_9MICO
MANILSTPLRIGAAVLVVLAIVAAGIVVLYGPEDGRWGIQGALGAGPDPSVSRSVSPSASPTTPDAASPSPSASRSMSLKEKNIAEAKERLVEYYATTAEVANDGYRDWERKLYPFWGKLSVGAAKGEAYQLAKQSGNRTEGAAEVVSMDATDYRPFEPGSEEVELTACIDFNNVKTFDSKGKMIPRDASIPLQYMFIYEMRNQGEGNDWAVLSEEPNREREC